MNDAKEPSESTSDHADDLDDRNEVDSVLESRMITISFITVYWLDPLDSVNGRAGVDAVMVGASPWDEVDDDCLLGFGEWDLGFGEWEDRPRRECPFRRLGGGFQGVAKRAERSVPVGSPGVWGISRTVSKFRSG